MSAQGGTLARRGTVRVPIWPVAALLGAAIVAAIGLSVIGGTEGRVITSVTDAERLANSSAAVREQGAVLPAAPAIRPFDPSVIESSAAAVREQAATAYHAAGRAHEVTVGAAPTTTTSIVGLENPGAYVTGVTGTTYISGLENPGAFFGDEAEVAPTAPHRPIAVDGEICGQCR